MEGIDRLAAAVDRAGRERWPDLDVEPATLRELLAGLEADPSPEHLADLYLVAGCIAAHPRALERFEAEQVPVVQRAVRQMGAPAHVVEDAVQHVRAVALVHHPERRSALSSYRGVGPLHSWVRVVAMREATRLLRAAQREPQAGDDEIFALVAPQADPELATMQAAYRDALREAFREAVAGLPRRERTALRMSVLDGLSIDAIAGVYRVHRATAARWLVAARDRLMRATRAALAVRLGVAGGDVDSVLRVIGSRLDISFATALRADEKP
ncbi:MAG TPA: sigma-70 family RNA polymerase sigma factor [Kofleriaceae bacterium]|nr:sigma-70 family RNA polymerase sigma factor [Kofleriaceae bacterium]